MKKLVLASRNDKKVKELQEILDGCGLEVVPVSAFSDAPEVEETGTTFRENALLKAEAVCSATGLPTLADDSGLQVDALNGEPGVYSARFAGPEADHAANNKLLLEKLSGLKGSERAARFVTVIALCFPQDEPQFFTGTCEGLILDEPSGSGGFGYDPLFFSPELGRTFADVGAEEKHAVSHRGRALENFRAALANGTVLL